VHTPIAPSSPSSLVHNIHCSDGYKESGVVNAVSPAAQAPPPSVQLCAAGQGTAGRQASLAAKAQRRIQSLHCLRPGGKPKRSGTLATALPAAAPRIRCGKASGRNSLYPGHPLMWTRGSGRKGRLAAVPRQKHTGHRPVTGARMQHACEVSTDERSRTAEWILWSNTSQIKCRRHAICHAGSSKGLGSHQNGALACGRHGRARSTRAGSHACGTAVAAAAAEGRAHGDSRARCMFVHLPPAAMARCAAACAPCRV
jgi:hypothetical protein